MLWLDLFCHSGSASRIIPQLATIASKRNFNVILSDSLHWASMGRKGLRPKVRRHLGTEGRCLPVSLRTSMSASRRPYFLTPSDPARPGRGSLPSSQGQGPKRRRGEGLRRYDLVTAKVNPGAGYLDHDTEGMNVLIDTTEVFLGPLGTRPASYLRSPCRSRLTSCSYIEAYVASCSTICSRLPLPPLPRRKIEDQEISPCDPISECGVSCSSLRGRLQGPVDSGRWHLFGDAVVWRVASRLLSPELAVGTGPHPDASIQKGGLKWLGRLARPRWTAARTCPKLAPSDQERQPTKPFRPDRQAHIKGLFSGFTVVIATAKGLGLLARSWPNDSSRLTGT